jgi:hypothetical protein
MLTGYPPYAIPKDSDIHFKMLAAGRHGYLLNGMGFKYGKQSQELLNLLKSLLDATDKPFSTRQALRHAWFHNS